MELSGVHVHVYTCIGQVHVTEFSKCNTKVAGKFNLADMKLKYMLIHKGAQRELVIRVN